MLKKCLSIFQIMKEWNGLLIQIYLITLIIS